MHYAVPRKITEQQERNCILSYCGLPVTTKPVPCILYLFFPLIPTAQKLKQTLEPCDTEYPAFVSERTIKETSGNIACEDCSKYAPLPLPPASFCLVETFPRWAGAAAMPRITMRAGKMAALLCEELFSSAWKEHHLASLEGSFRVWEAFKCMKIHPRI